MVLPKGQVDDNLLSKDAVTNPYPMLARLRESDPIHFSRAHSAWLITSYEDVNAILRGGELSSDRISPWYFGKLSPGEQAELEPTYKMLSSWMVFNDPPKHTRLRGLVQKAFTPRMIESLRKSIEIVVSDLLDSLHGAGRVDIIQEFAYPLPAIVIADMLGVPQSDRDQFKEWSDEVSALVFGALDDADRHTRAQNALADLAGYFGHMLDERARNPKNDLMSGLLRAQEAGDALDREEIVATCVLLLFAGHETTTNLIANATKALLEHPSQLAKLQDDHARFPLAIEELLRFDGPLKVQMRSVLKNLDFRGRHLEAGQRVFVVQTAANRDPERFPSPDELDIERHDATHHVGFGFGIHYCLGAPLARLETSIALRALISRFPEMTLAEQELAWHPVVVTRALKGLDIDL